MFSFFCLFRPPHNKSTAVTLMSVLIVGLLSLSGLIMFISIFKSEVYHKLQTDLSGKESLFSFNYGQSFLLYVIGFVVVELSGILNVCLFNKLQKIAQDNQVKPQVISIFRFLKSITLNHRIEVTTNLIFCSFPFSLTLSSCLSLSLYNLNKNNFQLNNYVKVGLMDLEPSAAANMCQHRVAAYPSNG